MKRNIHNISIPGGYLPNLRVFNGDAVCFLRGWKWTCAYVEGKVKGHPRTGHECPEGV